LAALNESTLMQCALMGAATALVAITQRSFDEPGLRPHSWAPRKHGSHPLMLKSGNLRQSLHARQLGADTADVRSPVKYAAIHQLGGVIRLKAGKNLKFKGDGGWATVSQVTIPPRPFFPVIEGQLTGHAQSDIEDVVDALIGAAGGS